MKTTFKTSLARVFFAVSFYSMVTNAISQDTSLNIPRSLTDQQGRTLDVTIIGVNEDSLKVRRNSDAKEFSLDPSQLSPDDRDFLKQLLTKIKNRREWIVDDFGDQLILPGHKDVGPNINQVSFAISNAGPVIAYADEHNIQLLQKKQDDWQSSDLNIDETNSTPGGGKIKIEVTQEGVPHIIFDESPFPHREYAPVYATLQENKWVTRKFSENAFGDIHRLYIQENKCRAIIAKFGFNTALYECDLSAITRVAENGGHFEDSRLTRDGKIFGISRWLPSKVDTRKILHFSQVTTRGIKDNNHEIIKVFDNDSEKLWYEAKLAVSDSGVFSVAYCSEEDFFYSVRKGDTTASGMIEGNWNLHPYNKNDFEFADRSNISRGHYIRGFEAVEDNISYMLYDTKDGNVCIAIFFSDGGCVIEKLASGKAISLTLDSEGNPHILYHRPDGVIHYARCNSETPTKPAANTVQHQEVNLLVKNVPLTGHVNHAEKIPTTPSGEAIEPTYPTAEKIDGKEGYVRSPYGKKRIVDVRGISSGTLVQDPSYPTSEKKFFRVP